MRKFFLISMNTRFLSHPHLTNYWAKSIKISYYKNYLFYSIFALSCLLNITGANDRRADTTTIMMDLNDITSPVVVKTYSSTPALIKPKDGGATPKKWYSKQKLIYTMPPMHKQNITNKWAQISVFCFLFLERGMWVEFKYGSNFWNRHNHH